MSDSNDYLQAIYWNKAESRARWSFIGILFPLIGVIIGLISLSTLKRVQASAPEKRKEATHIKSLAWTGIVVSLVVMGLGLFFMVMFLDALNRVDI